MAAAAQRATAEQAAQESREQQRQAMEEREKLKSEKAEFQRQFAAGNLTPNELQVALAYKQPAEVVGLIGRPDSTSYEDTEWAYHNRVLHPVTGQKDTLVIKFAVRGGELWTSYLKAGYGGIQWSLE
jgi:hypothetical protein